MKTLILKAGADGKATIVMTGKGTDLPMPTLPLALPATIQLHTQAGTCWESTFEAIGVSKNDATQFKGRSTLP